MPAKSTITGYYRYTDIWFEWASCLDATDEAAYLKAILAHDALTHRDHPLHEEGINGAKLYHGTFKDGMTRLVFSSAQVDYIRYWLHKMGYTKTLIPLPQSDSLLTMTHDLKSVSPVIYPDGGSLRNAIKKIDKENRKLKGANPLQTSRRFLFEQTRAFWQARCGVWLAIDFEAYEYEHNTITELGWSKISWDPSGEELHTKGHVIIRENYKLRNVKYVPEHRDDYGFGKSEMISKTDLGPRVCKLFEDSKQGPLFLVVHGGTWDLKQLKTLGAPVDICTHNLPSTAPSEGIFVIDTADMYAALEGLEAGNHRSLRTITINLGVMQGLEGYHPFHNAGNDATFTMLCIKSMASGDPVDTQRTQRGIRKVEQDDGCDSDDGFVPYE